jgi:queuine tRNA-ribosyltransferase
VEKIFSLKEHDKNTRARMGVLRTAHGEVLTPAFLPIGTRGSVKSVTAQELKFWGAQIVLANTYHLWMRPGDALVKKHGGLHRFMGWDGPILTDSGGFQVFSLGEKRHKADLNEGAGGESRHGRVIDIGNRGVVFRSDVDGQQYELTPESSIQIQSNLGSDIALVLDYFSGFPFTAERMKKAVGLTLDWAERGKRQFEKLKSAGINPGQVLFGIVQGGDSPELREECARGLRELDFSGYAIGGVAVGEPADVMYRAVELTVPHLEEDKPRHLLGVGTPEQLVRAVALGCDMFDCVLPTRNARHGLLYVNLKAGQGSGEGYTTMRISNEKYEEDFSPVDNTCGCYLCANHTRAYLKHLFQSRDPLAVRLATMHNLRFYLDLMSQVRRAIEYGSFEDMANSYKKQG